jgi:hypothetical protein
MQGRRDAEIAPETTKADDPQMARISQKHAKITKKSKGRKAAAGVAMQSAEGKFAPIIAGGYAQKRCMSSRTDIFSLFN